MIRTVARLLGIALLAASLLPSAPSLAGDPTVQFAPDDAEMNAAIAEARATLPHFFDRLTDSSLEIDSYAFKVAVPTTTRPGAEHIWMLEARPEGDGFVAIVGNEPNEVEGMAYGDTYRFTLDMVSDWNYWSGGRLHGGYTIRALLPYLSPAQAAEIRAVLAPLR